LVPLFTIWPLAIVCIRDEMSGEETGTVSAKRITMAVSVLLVTEMSTAHPPIRQLCPEGLRILERFITRFPQAFYLYAHKVLHTPLPNPNASGNRHASSGLHTLQQSSLRFYAAECAVLCRSVFRSTMHTCAEIHLRHRS
jgi:hypothetical protein